MNLQSKEMSDTFEKKTEKRFLDNKNPKANERDNKTKDWIPITKLGRLVKQGKIGSIEQIFYFSIPVKEQEIIDHFLRNHLKDEVLKIMPVQKQTRAGQRTRFKAFVIIGDFNRHIGLGIKTAKEIASAIRGALLASKLSIIQARKGFWGGKEGSPHTVPMKVTGKCGSVRLRCIPAPKGAGIVAARIPKKLLMLAGYQDVFTSSKGYTRTFGNFAKATFQAIYSTYDFVTPDLWASQKLIENPLSL